MFIKKSNKAVFKIKIICYIYIIDGYTTILCNETSVLLYCVEVQVRSRLWIGEKYFNPVHCSHKAK